MKTKPAGYVPIDFPALVIISSEAYDALFTIEASIGHIVKKNYEGVMTKAVFITEHGIDVFSLAFMVNMIVVMVDDIHAIPPGLKRACDFV